MTIPEKIRLALAYKRMSEAALARGIGSSPSAFNQRMGTGKFSQDDLDKIATAIGCEFDLTVRFPDGTVI